MGELWQFCCAFGQFGGRSSCGLGELFWGQWYLAQNLEWSPILQPYFGDSPTKFRRFRNQNQIRFRNQKKTFPQPKKRRFRNQKKTFPQPKKDDSATKKRRFPNQTPRDSATKIRITLQPRSVLLHSAWHRLQTPGGVGWGGGGQQRSCK